MHGQRFSSGLITVTPHSGEAQEKMPALKLTYFNVEGAAEKIRLAFKLGGIEFDDERIERANWPALKPSAPFGQLPLLSIDGKPPISQSNAILRYAGRLSGLYPEDPLQAMRVDEVIGLHDDFFRSIKPTQEIISRPQDFGYPPDLSDTEKKALQSKMRSALMAEGGDIPRYLGYFESILEKNGRFRTFAPRPLPPSTRHARHTSLIRPPRRAANACAARAGSGFTCGAGPTIADLVLFVSLRVFRSGRLDGIPADLLDAYPRIGALLDAVARLPAVAAHYGQP